jgi:hypothetical protein
VGLGASVHGGAETPLLMEKLLRWWKGERLPLILKGPISGLKQQGV